MNAVALYDVDNPVNRLKPEIDATPSMPLVDDFRELVDRCVGALERRARRQLHDGEHIALVFVRHETGRARAEHEVEHAEHRRESHHHE